MLKKGGTVRESKMAKLPVFANEQEAADWFAANDTADYMSSLEVVKEKIPVRRTRSAEKPIDLRLPADQFEAIKKIAKREGIPYESLIRSWLLERLHREAR